MRRPELSLVKAVPRDLPMIKRWVAQPDIRRWWGYAVLVQQELRADITVMKSPATSPYLIAKESRTAGPKPLGLVHVYDSKPLVKEYCREITPGGFNIDILIASRNMRGFGIGTWAIKEARRLALQATDLEEAPPAFYACVLENNMASRRAFEKAGYRLYDGPDAQSLRPDTILWLEGVPYGND